MAESEKSQTSDGFFAAAGRLIESLRTTVNEAVGPIAEPLMRDGTLAAAWRQGADEAWQGLKAFPESIEGQAAGAILNPTQGEVAEARRPNEPATLEDVLTMDTSNVKQQENSKDLGMGR